MDTGKIRYVINNFPLERIHSMARKAAEVSLCAGEQGKFWPLHDRFFADQTKLAASDIPEHVTAIAANPVVFKKCLEQGKYAAKVAADLTEGHDLQVRGTPTFFIGYSDPSDASRIWAVRSIVGHVPYADFQKVIAEVLGISQQRAGAEK